MRNEQAIIMDEKETASKHVITLITIIRISAPVANSRSHLYFRATDVEETTTEQIQDSKCFKTVLSWRKSQ